MNTRLKNVLISLSILAIFSGPVLAGGHTAQQMERAGFDCPNLGPSNWMHCMDIDVFVAGEVTAIPVKVFTEDGSKFKGTELHLRKDIYLKSLRPCPPDELDMWGGYRRWLLCLSSLQHRPPLILQSIRWLI